MPLMGVKANFLERRKNDEELNVKISGKSS
jgi:hypothetical protein